MISKNRNMQLSIVIILVLFAAINCVASNRVNTDQTDKVETGKAMPSFSMTTPDGKILKSEDLKGKVLVLDFWATWCVPCKKLTGEINEQIKGYHDKKNFKMIGVNYREYNKDLALRYWNEHAYKFPMASDKDTFGTLIKAGNPTILVVDKSGIVRGRWDAYTPETAIDVKTLIDSLL